MTVFYKGEAELPEIKEAFTIVLNKANWHQKAAIFKRILNTINPKFLAYIPDFPNDEIFTLAKNCYLKKIYNLFEAHGLKQIKIEILDEVRELYLTRP